MTHRLAAFPLLLVVAATAACGGKSIDPRCVSLCVVTEPDLDGAYDVCSAASAKACEQECDARIAEVTTLCASCLLEEACFAPDCGASGSNDFCDGSGQCTVTGREGDCTYPQGDEAARDDCLRQVYPRRTVDCTPEFRPVAECGNQCGGAALDGGN